MKITPELTSAALTTYLLTSLPLSAVLLPRFQLLVAAAKRRRSFQLHASLSSSMKACAILLRSTGTQITPSASVRTLYALPIPSHFAGLVIRSAVKVSQCSCSRNPSHGSLTLHRGPHSLPFISSRGPVSARISRGGERQVQCSAR